MEKEVQITSENVSDFFDVTNGVYYFAWDGDELYATNIRRDSTTASTILRAKTNLKIKFKAFYTTEEDCDILTVLINGGTYRSWSGAGVHPSDYIAIPSGGTFEIKYKKDGSESASGEECYLSSIYVTCEVESQTGGKALINGTAYKISSGKACINGASHNISHGKTMIGGTVYNINFNKGTKISTLPVGSSVWMNVSGVRKEFLIINIGNPNTSYYDASCDGTWILMKDCYKNRGWHSSNVNGYASSTIHSYLNGTFLGLLDANIQAAIKQVKLPYRAGSGYRKTVTSGSNGLSAKIFLLSSTEVNLVHGYEPTNEGACLSYFSGTAQDAVDSKRVANLNGSATFWWLRSPYCDVIGGSTSALFVNTNGSWHYDLCSSSYGIRPALVLNSNALVDDNFNVIG